MSYYLDEINNFPDEIKAEFLEILKSNLITFFDSIEVAIKNNDKILINNLIHKVNPTLIMLEANSTQLFFSNLRNHIIAPANLQDILLEIKIEKQTIKDKGWI